MNSSKNKSAADYKAEMTKRINLSAFAGVFILFVNFITGVILIKYFSEISYTVYMLFLFLNTCLSMLPFLILYHVKCEKIGKLITMPREKRCGFPKWVMAVMLGFGLCTTVNFLTSLISAGIFNVETGTAINKYITDIPSLCMAVLVVGIVPAVCEELLFRGCIIGSLKKYNVLMSVVISSVIFALIHSGISGMIFAFLSGMILGFVRIYTGYFSAAVAVHFMNNALAISTAAAGSLISEDADSMVFYTAGIIGIVLTLVCIILILLRKIRLDCIFSENTLHSAQPVEDVVSSSSMRLVFVLCAILTDM